MTGFAVSWAGSPAQWRTLQGNAEASGAIQVAAAGGASGWGGGGGGGVVSMPSGGGVIFPLPTEDSAFTLEELIYKYKSLRGSVFY